MIFPCQRGISVTNLFPKSGKKALLVSEEISSLFPAEAVRTSTNAREDAGLKWKNRARA
jgi:hypothetical protein